LVRIWRALLASGAAAGLASAFTAGYTLGGTHYAGIAAAALYALASSPVVALSMRSLGERSRLQGEFRSLCQGRLGGVYSEVWAGSLRQYCLRRRGGELEGFCLNAAYSMLSAFHGRPGEAPIRVRAWDYTCIRPAVGVYSDAGEGRVYRGVFHLPPKVLPSPLHGAAALVEDLEGGVEEAVRVASRLAGVPVDGAG